MFDAGDGTRVRFWYDKWSGHYSLKDLYPNQYACTVAMLQYIQSWIANWMWGTQLEHEML